MAFTVTVPTLCLPKRSTQRPSSERLYSPEASHGLVGGRLLDARFLQNPALQSSCHMRSKSIGRTR